MNDVVVIALKLLSIGFCCYVIYRHNKTLTNIEKLLKEIKTLNNSSLLK